MRKIGLLLDADHHFGGMFQYNQAMLEAVSSLRSDEFSIVVVHTSKLWTNYLPTRGIKALYVRIGLLGRVFWKIWSELNFPLTVWRKTFSPFYSLTRSVIKEKCDLWIFPTQDSISLQIPVTSLSAVHDLMHRYESRFPELSAHGIYRRREWVCRNACIFSSGILVDSKVGKIHIMESYGVPAYRIHVLPYTAPNYIYGHHGHREPADFNSRYILPKKFIFYPAHFWKHKNHKTLISAIALLKKDIPDVQLVLCGTKKNGYRSTLKLIHGLNLTGNIIILGYVPDEDIGGLYRRARALVMPTFLGPTNIPPLEAFVSGCPVAVSGVYGMPEQVGDAALLFNPESTDEIAHCIRQLWNDDELCRELSRRGRQRAETWSKKHFQGRLKEIIEHVLEKKQ